MGTFKAGAAIAKQWDNKTDGVDEGEKCRRRLITEKIL